MKIGDTVRVIGVPNGLTDGDLNTKSVFKRCVGHVFPIAGFQRQLLELEVGELFGTSAPCQTIWIEPEFVEVLKQSHRRTAPQVKPRKKR